MTSAHGSVAVDLDGGILLDADGNSLIDFASGIAVTGVGACEPSRMTREPEMTTSPT